LHNYNIRDIINQLHINYKVRVEVLPLKKSKKMIRQFDDSKENAKKPITYHDNKEL